MCVVVIRPDMAVDEGVEKAQGRMEEVSKNSQKNSSIALTVLACPFFSTHPCTSSDEPLLLPRKKRPCLLASSTLPSQRTMIALLLKLHSLV